MEFVRDTLVNAAATIQGIFFALAQTIELLKRGDFSELLGGTSIVDAFQAGIGTFLEDFEARTRGPEGGLLTAQNQVNINKVEIRNDFKERMEPDRIAFTLKEQLLKAAQNPTQANRGAFATTGAAR